ncbi:MAG: 1-acyl-sn-glycerol-3-phosphate acyltransferase [Ruminococcus sp.]|nr:1-acyl-sn-glycerol-3-phosphate acyltransferase [Ruminococcus sp.]
MKRVYYYSDEVNDDFASTNGKINSDVVNGAYRYSHSSIGWKTSVFFAYRIFATPLVWLYTKIWLGVRVKNRKALKKVKGCFVYMNHTQNIADAFIPTISAFPKRAYIVTGPETVSIKGIRVLVALLGAIPLPSALSACRNFEQKLKEATDEKAAVYIFPEAHIWPYCSFIRNFPDKSFSYPCRTGSPVVAAVTVYRQRKVLKKFHPHITVYFSEPFYPDSSLPEKQARKKLRDEAYAFMSRTAKEHNSFEYVKYVYKDADEPCHTDEKCEQ